MKRKRFLLSGSGSDGDAMHPLNPYRNNKPDFLALGCLYPDILGDVLIRHKNGTSASLDWTNPASQRALTTALLRHDFGIQHFVLSEDKLCPPVPNRANYVCWVQELVSSSSSTTTTTTTTTTSSSSPARVLDIGVGASCIYPLLGHQMFQWQCLASDIDPSSVTSSQQIVAGNQLQNAVEVVLVEPCLDLQEHLLTLIEQTQIQVKVKSTPLSSFLDSGSSPSSPSLSPSVVFNRKGPVIRALEAAAASGNGRWSDDTISTISSNIDKGGDTCVLLDACMTNPPFYAQDEHVEPNLYAACTGSRAEMHTRGGEVGFVLALLLDSLVLRRKVRWYSTMVGKKSSLKTLLRVLKVEEVKQVRSTKFLQGSGSATVRWGLAWSFWEDEIEDSTMKKRKVNEKYSRGHNGGGHGDGVLMKELAEMSVQKLLLTARQAERAAASTAVWSSSAFGGLCTAAADATSLGDSRTGAIDVSAGQDKRSSQGMGTLISVAVVEEYFRSRDYRPATTEEKHADEEDTAAVPASSPCADVFTLIADLDRDSGVKEKQESITQLKNAALLSLCMTRITCVFESLHGDAFVGGRFSMDTAKIDALSTRSVIIPLIFSLHETPATPTTASATGIAIRDTCAYKVQLSVVGDNEGEEVRLVMSVEAQGQDEVGPDMRAVFFKIVDLFEADWQRSNRRWRRLLAPPHTAKDIKLPPSEISEDNHFGSLN